MIVARRFGFELVPVLAFFAVVVALGAFFAVLFRGAKVGATLRVVSRLLLVAGEIRVELRLGLAL